MPASMLHFDDKLQHTELRHRGVCVGSDTAGLRTTATLARRDRLDAGPLPWRGRFAAMVTALLAAGALAAGAGCKKDRPEPAPKPAAGKPAAGRAAAASPGSRAAPRRTPAKRSTPQARRAPAKRPTPQARRPRGGMGVSVGVHEQVTITVRDPDGGVVSRKTFR